jgi:hypothetical protein
MAGRRGGNHGGSFDDPRATPAASRAQAVREGSVTEHIRKPRLLVDDAPAHPLPMSAVEHVATVASQQVEELEAKVKRLGHALSAVSQERDTLRDHVNELKGAQSVWALTAGGQAVVQQGEILAALQRIEAHCDRIANYMQGVGMKVELLEADAKTQRERVDFLMYHSV